ncbi:Eukaryotic translation initiation factor 2a, partial [Globisporangium splendens]
MAAAAPEASLSLLVTCHRHQQCAIPPPDTLRHPNRSLTTDCVFLSIAVKESVAELLRTKFFLRGKQGIEALWGLPLSSKEQGQVEKDESIGAPQADLMEFSADGAKIVLVNTQLGFTVRNTEGSEVVLEVSNPGIQAIAWSPLGSHLLTWQRPQKEAEQGNLIVWNATTGAEVARFNQKSYSRDNWPSIQWSSDETICGRQSANGVVLYSGTNIAAGSIGQINLPNTTNFSVAPGSAPYKIALFVPEKKGKPASVKVYHFPGLETVVASKSFYKAQEVNMKWSPNGSALVIETRTDVDTTGKSYYGETGLFFLQSDGAYDCIVPLTKEGQIHDVQWDPTGRGFVVLAGSMPCNATLYDSKAIPIFEFGAAPRNHVSWSPHGRFLCIAGFGNLRGDMDFWERNKLKKMGSANSNSATTFAWSPDSRYFFTATTFPRLRVDNGFKVFRYDGTGPIYQEDRTELYDMKFRPATPGYYPNRPQSPRRKGEEAAVAVSAPAPAKPQAYRPPNSTGALAAMMRKEETGSKRLDRNKYVAPNRASSTIPGMSAAPKPIPGMSAAAAAPKKPSKSARKKKAVEAAEAQKAVQEALAKVNGGAAPAAVSAPAAAAPSTPVAAAPLTEEEKQKKIKALTKKLKQIDAIKEKQAKGDTLNDDQVQKLGSEKALRDEIAQLS